jgi:ATP-dependent helicase/nuclease subunit B
MKFTDQIAEYIDENKLDPRHLTIVLPSERAIKYISSSLFKKNNGPLLAPEMITIDRWIRRHSDHIVIDRTRLLVKLFAVQMENPADPKDASFDEFQTWGQILLSDFDEIDRYLLNPDMVFRNLADIREIENWSFNSTDPTPAQQRFMDFWDRLPSYYKRLNEILDEEGACYMGKAYRSLADNIDQVFQKDKDRKFLFAGFNALSKAELSIMKQLHRMGRAHILIDADRFYLDDPVHEAGMFIRSFIKTLEVKELPFVKDTMRTKNFDINVIECAQQTGQVKAAASILGGLSTEELNETLVLLADEGLIVPLLKNIPSAVGKANISLGLPLKNTAIRTWIELLFNIQENKLRFKTDALYFQDLQKFWNHPFVNAILNDEERSKVLQLELKAVKSNKIFRNRESVKVSETLDQLLAKAATIWSGDWIKAMEAIRSTIAYIHQFLPKSDEFNLALVEGFDQSIQEFDNIVQEGIPEMNLKSFKNLLQQHWINKSIAYHGNPIQGLQIMGLLETRLLDFKNIIVLGLNEGKMPPTNPIQTMIPMDLRSWLELPTPREKQGLFAHHFYRLLHNAENLWITFSSARENIGSNESSRYLLQLELELQRLNPNLRMTKKLYNIPEENVMVHKAPVISKTPEILAKMDALFKKSVSASALNKYLKCPLDFYYRYVLEFGEEDDFEEEVEMSTFGSFIHTVLEELYEPFARHDKTGRKKDLQPRAITSFDIDDMLKKFELLIRAQFMDRYNGDEKAFTSGKNLLSFKMAIELTKRFLESEKDFLKKQTLPVFIEFLELEIQNSIKVIVNGEEKEIRLKGIIDRIDSIGDKIRIVDYKTGKVASEEVKVNLNSEDYLSVFSKPKHGVQMTMYSYLYRSEFNALPNEVALYSLIKLKDGLFYLNGGDKYDLKEITEAFPFFLEQLLNEMYDPEVPFAHQKGWSSYCLYCE